MTSTTVSAPLRPDPADRAAFAPPGAVGDTCAAAEDLVTTLLGVPRRLLDELARLRDLAHARALDLPHWRSEHTAALAGTDLPDPDHLGVLRELAAGTALAAEDREWVLRVRGREAADREDEPAPVDLSHLGTPGEARAFADRVWALHAHLVLLEGPPTDEVVTTVLPTSDRDRREALANHAPGAREQLLAAGRHQEHLHRLWLTDVADVGDTADAAGPTVTDR